MRDWQAHRRDCDECRLADRDPHVADQQRCADGAELCAAYVADVEREARRPSYEPPS
jgi:hypothetical protein